MPLEEIIKERSKLRIDFKQETPILVINAVIFTISKDKLCVIMTPNKESQNGELILPGGLVMKGYSLADNIDDIVSRKIGLSKFYREQLYVFGNPCKILPDVHFVTVTYFSLVSIEKILREVDLTKVSFVEYDNIDNISIGLNHQKIIKFAKNKLNFRLEYTTIGQYVMPHKFSIPQMQKKYEIMYGEKFDKRNFRKKVEKLEIVSFTGEYNKTDSYRPAKLYEFVNKGIEYLDDERVNLGFNGNMDIEC
ncbi:MAG: hypothetical protein PHZ26_03425 [Candidatus Gracilibacteria bacterium]|nr:hypothetical protein [Candidatus Gracilibacteria bacterium]MDD2908777.1 hypothetical protein [Candidatus Gracilibacteria bacterium]